MTAVPTFKFFSQPIPPFNIIAPVSLVVDCVVSLIVSTPLPVIVVAVTAAHVATPETCNPVVRPTRSIPPPLIVIPPVVTFIPSLKVLIPRASTCFTSS